MTTLAEEIKKTVDTLRKGGIILYPTDTTWSIGCDATNSEAVSRINKISEDYKNRTVLIDKIGRIPSYVSEMPDLAWDLVELADKPLTIIYPKAKNLAQNLVAADGSIAIRVVNHEFCAKLIERFGKPIVSITANLSGKPLPKIFEDIAPEITSKVDQIIPEEFDKPTSNKLPGIIMLGVGGEIKIIRE